MLSRILGHLRRRFIDGPRGFGHPVPAAAFDEEFRSGHWRLLDSPDEQARYAALAAMIRTHAVRRPCLLDAGCGGGLAGCFTPDELASYHGVDLSAEAIRQAQVSTRAGGTFEQGDLEAWATSARYDVIVINEVIGYFHDPAATLARLGVFLGPGGVLVISLYRWGNAPAIWRRLDRGFKTTHATSITNAAGDKTWDIRILLPAAVSPAPSP